MDRQGVLIATIRIPDEKNPRAIRLTVQEFGEQILWPVFSTFSSALWYLLRANGASGGSRRRVQYHSGANEHLKRLFIDRVVLMEIDGTPGVAFEAGVEE